MMCPMEHLKSPSSHKSQSQTQKLMELLSVIGKGLFRLLIAPTTTHSPTKPSSHWCRHPMMPSNTLKFLWSSQQRVEGHLMTWVLLSIHWSNDIVSSASSIYTTVAQSHLRSFTQLGSLMPFSWQLQQLRQPPTNVMSIPTCKSIWLLHYLTLLCPRSSELWCNF